MSSATGMSSRKPTATTNSPTERHFRGTFAHVLLHELVETKQISPAAAWMAMTIDSLCKGKRGCFASDKHLGSKAGVKARQARNLLAQLEQVKILKSRWEGDLRYLWIDWTQDAETERKSAYKAETRAAKNCRSERQKIAYREEDTNVSSKQVEKDRPATPGRLAGGENTSSANLTNPNQPKVGLSEACGSVPVNRVEGMFRKDGPPPVYADNGYPGHCYEFADRLHKLADQSQRRSTKINRKAWAATFHQIITNQFAGNVQRIRRCVELLEKHVGEEGWPKSIRHPKNFANVVSWVEEANGQRTGETAPVDRVEKISLGFNKRGEERFTYKYV